MTGRHTVNTITSDALDALYEQLADYENRITWHTTCGSCARILDSSIRETERAERAEVAVTQVRQLLATGQIGCCAHLVRAALDDTRK